MSWPRGFRWKKIGLVLIAGLLLVNILVLGLIGWQGYTLITRFELNGSLGRLQRLGTSLDLVNLTSLGLIKYGPTGAAYRLAKEGVDFGKRALHLQTEVQPLLLRSLSGKSVDQAEISRLGRGIKPLSDRLALVILLAKTPDIQRLLGIFHLENKFSQGINKLERGAEILKLAQEPENDWLAVLGYAQPQHYVVLMQNNMELRPTGGFLGSYAEFWLDQGALTNLKISDIYVPDGQIKGYVKEPLPIVKYLFTGGTPGWRLRDSNWEPDFPKAAKQIAWFFEEGGLAPIDGMIGVNLFLIEDLLKVMGTLEMPDYHLTVTAETFYRQAQYAAEHDFFPGSTQKGDFLAAAGKALLKALLEDYHDRLPDIVKAVYRNLENKQITVSLINQPNNTFFSKTDWDGSLKPIETKDGELNDFLYINEANLGINKTNCCLERKIDQVITVSDEANLTHELTLTYKNNNPGTPKPPVAWGGGYKDYLRIYIPKQATLKYIRVNNDGITDFTQDEVGDKRLIGFMVLTEGGETDTIRIAYNLPLPNDLGPATYRLMIQKQPGIDGWPMTLKFNQGQIALETDQFLTKDSIFTFPMVY